MNKVSFDLSNECSGNVVVLGAGPSISKNINKIKDYIKSHNSLVVATSYDFGIKTDYTVFVGKKLFISRIKKIKNKKIIITECVLNFNKKYIEKDKYHKYYLVSSKIPNACPVSYWDSKINIDENCLFNHKLTNCGFTSILISCFFCPKTILVCGMDGPNFENLSMDHFHGETRFYKGEHKDIKKAMKKSLFLVDICDFLNKKNIVLKSFKNDNLWGAKEKLRVLGNFLEI